MKKYCLFIIFLAFGATGQIVNIPDPQFKARLLEANSTPFLNFIAHDLEGNATAIDTNGDQEIQISEAQNISFLNVGSSGITSLEGISAFTNMTTLYCGGNQLTSLDVTALTQLLIIGCPNNQIQTLSLTGLTSLLELDCGENLLTQINLPEHPNLVTLDCRNNFLTSLDASGNTHLKNLIFPDNMVSSLDVTGCTSLEWLLGGRNQLPNLALSSCTSLIALNCDDNLLTTLDLHGLPALEVLACNNNQITDLNLSGDLAFYGCFCDNNRLSTLDFSQMPQMRQIYCRHNELTSLLLAPVTPNIYNINCEYNYLTTLDLSGLPDCHQCGCSNNQLVSLFIKSGNANGIFPLPDFSGNPALQYMCVDDFNIPAAQSAIAQYGYNCEVNTYCSFVPGRTYYTIKGTSRFDADNNGCSDADVPVSNLTLHFTNVIGHGDVIPNNYGQYSLPLSEGAHTITPALEHPEYFTVSPSTVTVNFPEDGDPHYQDFCMSAIGQQPDLEITMLSPDIVRPGFYATYKLVYVNTGNTSVTGSVSLTYDDSIMDFVSAMPALSSQGSDQFSWNFSDLRPFESRSILLTLYLNSPVETPAVNAGQILEFTAVANNASDMTPANNIFTLHQTVRNSQDPNDKTCLEGNTVTPDMAGKFVHYMIRFENTGTANAQNVVVADNVDPDKFDISTLIPISGSHDFYTRINGNKAEFIFENINLPFDDANNDGYVAFKIKTTPTLTVGDTFSNTAGIYFDYNFPVVTNTATTTIATLAVKDFEFEDYFTVYPNPAKDVLNISLKKEISISSVSVYNMLGQLVSTGVGSQGTIDVSTLKTGSYLVKIFTSKGVTNSRFVKD